MKKNNPTPKSAVVKALQARGLRMIRIAVDGKRVWYVSDGKTYPGLMDVYIAYMPKKGS